MEEEIRQLKTDIRQLIQGQETIRHSIEIFRMTLENIRTTIENTRPTSNNTSTTNSTCHRCGMWMLSRNISRHLKVCAPAGTSSQSVIEQIEPAVPEQSIAPAFDVNQPSSDELLPPPKRKRGRPKKS